MKGQLIKTVLLGWIVLGLLGINSCHLFRRTVLGFSSNRSGNAQYEQEETLTMEEREPDLAIYLGQKSVPNRLIHSHWKDYSDENLLRELQWVLDEADDLRSRNQLDNARSAFAQGRLVALHYGYQEEAARALEGIIDCMRWDKYVDIYLALLDQYKLETEGWEGDWLGHGLALEGMLFKRLDLNQRAIDSFTASADAYREFGNLSSAANWNRQAGDLYSDKFGEYALAEAQYNQIAASGMWNSGARFDQTWVVWALNEAGKMSGQRGDPVAAEESYNQALKLAVEAGLTAYQLDISMNSARLALSLNQSDKVCDRLDEAFQYRMQLPADQSLENGLQEFARLRLAAGDTAMAWSLYDRALETVLQRTDNWMGVALGNILLEYTHQGKPEIAINVLDNLPPIEEYKPGAFENHMSIYLCRALVEDRQPDRALKELAHLRELLEEGSAFAYAAEVSEMEGEAYLLLNRTDDAMERFAQSMQEAVEEKLPELQTTMQLRYASTAAMQGDYALAVEHYYIALRRLLDEYLRLGYFSRTNTALPAQISECASGLADVLNQTGKTESALQVGQVHVQLESVSQYIQTWQLNPGLADYRGLGTEWANLEYRPPWDGEEGNVANSLGKFTGVATEWVTAAIDEVDIRRQRIFSHLAELDAQQAALLPELVKNCPELGALVELRDSTPR